MVVAQGAGWSVAAAAHLLAVLLAVLFGGRRRGTAEEGGSAHALSAIADLADEVRAWRPPEDKGPPAGGAVLSPEFPKDPAVYSAAGRDRLGQAGDVALGLLLALVLAGLTGWWWRRSGDRTARPRVRGAPRRHGGGRLE